MYLKEFEIFKQNYRENCKTKSDNYLVLKLYSFILRNEESDSDFWNLSAGRGFGDIDYILNDFDENDWQMLTADIANWTEYQKELLSEGLLTVNYSKNEFSESEILNIEKRFEIIPLLLKIANTNAEITENIGDFIKIYISKINLKNLEVIEAITELKKWSDTQFCIDLITREKVESPNTAIINNAYKKVCC